MLTAADQNTKIIKR